MVQGHCILDLFDFIFICLSSSSFEVSESSELLTQTALAHEPMPTWTTCNLQRGSLNVESERNSTNGIKNQQRPNKNNSCFTIFFIPFVSICHFFFWGPWWILILSFEAASPQDEPAGSPEERFQKDLRIFFFLGCWLNCNIDYNSIILQTHIQFLQTKTRFWWFASDMLRWFSYHVFLV